MHGGVGRMIVKNSILIGASVSGINGLKRLPWALTISGASNIHSGLYFMAIFLQGMLKRGGKQQKQVKEQLAASGKAEQEMYYSGYKDVITTVVTQNTRQVSFNVLIYQFKITPDAGDVFVKSTLEQADTQRNWSLADFERPEEAVKQCIQAAAAEHLNCYEHRLASVQKKSLPAGGLNPLWIILFCILFWLGFPTLLTESTLPNNPLIITDHKAIAHKTKPEEERQSASSRQESFDGEKTQLTKDQPIEEISAVPTEQESSPVVLPRQDEHQESDIDAAPGS
ncbi:MAG: hypothetical protein D3923_18860, partial [Candidatus Electrothrix sp. AR3]|nr:hypothetical protein [Candidatus Electrothrix sp. AR3]